MSLNDLFVRPLKRPFLSTNIQKNLEIFKFKSPYFWPKSSFVFIINEPSCILKNYNFFELFSDVKKGRTVMPYLWGFHFELPVIHGREYCFVE